MSTNNSIWYGHPSQMPITSGTFSGGNSGTIGGGSGGASGPAIAVGSGFTGTFYSFAAGGGMGASIPIPASVATGLDNPIVEKIKPKNVRSIDEPFLPSCEQ